MKAQYRIRYGFKGGNGEKSNETAKKSEAQNTNPPYGLEEYGERDP